MTRSLALAAALLAASAGGAFAQDALEFTAEPWSGSAVYSQADGSFSHCLMAAQFDRQMSLVVAVDRAGGASLGIRNPRWSLALLEQQEMAFTLGSAQRHEAIATAVDATLLLVRFAQGDVILEELARAPIVSVAQENQSYQFVIVNGEAATEALQACVTAAGGSAETVAAAGDDDAADAGSADEDRERTILVDPLALDQTVARNFLQAAGLTDFTLMTPAETADFLSDARAAWTDGIIYGALFTIAPRQSRLDRAADDLLAVLTEGCEGEFTSSEIVEPDDGVAMARRAAVCDEDELGIMFRATAVDGESGTLIIVHAGLSDAADRLSTADDMMIAAIRRGQVEVE